MRKETGTFNREIFINADMTGDIIQKCQLSKYLIISIFVSFYTQYLNWIGIIV